MTAQMLEGQRIGGGKVDKVLYEFPILHEGWEMDTRGWVVRMDSGEVGLIVTSHDRPFLADKECLVTLIERYKRVISRTEEAIKLL